MVIYKVFTIKELKFIKRSMHCNQVIDGISILVGRHQMNSLINTIKMNDHNVRLTSVSINIWLYQPVACVLIRFQAHKRKPLYECTIVVIFVLMLKGEEEKCDLFQTNLLCRCLDQC